MGVECLQFMCYGASCKPQVGAYLKRVTCILQLVTCYPQPTFEQMVRPKKSLGQHFLKDRNIARKIVDALDVKPGYAVVEIGPGTGVLTELLIDKEIQLRLVEIDSESVAHLHEHFPMLKGKVIHGDFLELPAPELAAGPFAIIGNFPYNISSQIFFRVIEMRQQVTQVVCMLQKEVAKRLVASKGNKTYGILSVLLQAYFDMKYLFDVPPGVFNPPPKVTSGVIRLTRNTRLQLGCDEDLFTRLVKQGFQNRRKTLRNALKNLNLPAAVYALDVMDRRAEQLSVEEFITLTRQVEKEGERAGTI
jgi:16S rRNA (adenine1518-N6/adenine1519-N6)-dimethyltransferase